MRGEPVSAAVELGAHAQRVHAPSNATGMFERPGDQLVERVQEQLPLTNRSEKRECGSDRLWTARPSARPPGGAGGELPQPPAGRAELRGDRRFGQCRERAEGTDAELAEPAIDA